MGNRDKLRAATLGVPVERKKKIVEWNGSQIECRQPLVGERAQIMKKSRIVVNDQEQRDLGQLLAWSCILCCYEPGTDDRVFDQTDVEVMLASPCGSWIDELGYTVLELMNLSTEEARKNSSTTRSAVGGSASQKS